MKGNARETKEYSKEIGIFEGKVVGVNPGKEELENILQTEIEKEPVYTGEKDGIKNVRISVWLEDIWSDEGKKFNCSFFLQNEPRLNKDKTKVQYINSVGQTAWGKVEEKGKDLPQWFTHFVDKSGAIGESKEYRKALVGEEELITFIKSWLTYDLFDPNTDILLNTEKLISGNVKELTQEIDGEMSQTVVCMATVRSVTKEDEHGQPVTTNYQSVYNKAFAAGFNYKFFRGVEFGADKVRRIKEKSSKKLESYERFILSVADTEYGCKDSYYIGIKKQFNPEEFVNAGDKVLDSSDAEY